MDATASAPPADPYAAARNYMVDGQVRPNKVTHGPLLDAMRRLPREKFVPAAMAARAYADEDVPLGGGRVLMEPMVIARLIQLAEPRRGERALVVAAGSGYGSALLAALGVVVVALEEDAALLARARDTLRLYAPSAHVTEGRLADGDPSGAPYDLILIEGAVGAIPPGFAAQLRQGGDPPARLVAVLAGGRGGVAVLAEAVGATLRERAGFDCATPPIPALTPRAGFRF